MSLFLSILAGINLSFAVALTISPDQESSMLSNAFIIVFLLSNAFAFIHTLFHFSP
jgi:hypothetical protein